MQKRFHISYHTDYDAAQAAKKAIETKQPKDTFQIRKRARNFELVSRVDYNEAKITTENNSGVYPKKKKSPKRAWKKSKEAKPFSYEYRNEESRAIGRGRWTPVNPFAQMLKGE
jgi:hypothetical protein